MARRIGHSKLKTLYYNEYFERKRIIVELETSLTGAPIDAFKKSTSGGCRGKLS